MLGTVRVREVVGVVTSQEALDRLATDLMTAGFDRGNIDLMASRDAVLKKLDATYIDPIAAADVPDVPRRDLITRDDVAVSSALVFGTLITIGTFGAALPIVASGGALAAAIASAAGGGVLAAGIAKVIRDHVIKRDDAINIEKELRQGGLVIFVRTRTPEEEAKAQEIMVRCRARNVHVHEIELKKGLDDVPLSQIRPDPWLGDEKLGN